MLKILPFTQAGQELSGAARSYYSLLRVREERERKERPRAGLRRGERPPPKTLTKSIGKLSIWSIWELRKARGISGRLPTPPPECYTIPYYALRRGPEQVQSSPEWSSTPYYA